MKSPLESIVNTLRSELFTRSKSQSSEYTPRHGIRISAKRVPGIFSHFSQVRGKSHQLPRFPLLHSQRTWWSDCNSTYRTDSCGENFEVQLQWDRCVGATRGLGARKGVSKVESTDGGLPVFSTPFGISFIMRTQSTFSWPPSLVLATGDHSAPLGRSIPIGHSFLKSRASIYWVFSSVKIFHRTFLSETGSCSSADVFRTMSHNDRDIKLSTLCLISSFI